MEVGKYSLSFDGTLGDFVKFWRKSKKINSKELAKEIGKSDSYISHLENDRYKSPDYDTLYEIFKRIGIKEEKIEDYLYHFSVISPERELWEEEQALIAMQEPSVEDFEEMEEKAKYHEQLEANGKFKEEVSEIFKGYSNSNYNSDELLEDIFSENIKHIVYNLHNIIEHEPSDGFALVTGINNIFDNISTDKHLYKFTIKLFAAKLSGLDEKGMIEVLNTIYKELNRIDLEKIAFGKPHLRSLINEL